MALRVMVCVLWCVAGIMVPAAADDSSKKKSVKAGGIELSVPESWKQAQKTSQFRAAQFAITGDSDDEQAELVVYYFGGPTGGRTS